MNEIVVATNNKHKIEEIQFISKEFTSHFKFYSMKEFGVEVDIPEEGKTFEENALIKARFLFEKLKGKYSVIADDSGLMVDALNGQPGVHSARYAGDIKSDFENRKLLLKNLKGIENRNAKFVCAIAFISQTKEIEYFKGICKGKIAKIENGIHGFGYDKIFIPDGYNVCFAEMSESLKNSISHRYKALKNMFMRLSFNEDKNKD